MNLFADAATSQNKESRQHESATKNNLLQHDKQEKMHPPFTATFDTHTQHSNVRPRREMNKRGI